MDNFSNLMVVGECLLDAKRTRFLKKAIMEVVGHNHVVIDGGTGVGVLALFSAMAGAKKVYGIELDPGLANMAKRSVKLNGFEDRVEIISGDITKVHLPRADVVTMEMLDTGLIAEQQIPAINHLVKTGTIDKDTVVIPGVFETYIQFVHYNFKFHGLYLPIILQARNFGVMNRIKSYLSDKLLTDTKKFNEINDLYVHFDSSFTPSSDGITNAILMTSKIKLSNNIETWGTSDMNMPVILPIEEKSLFKYQKQKYSIKYKLAHGFNTVNFNWL